MKKFKLIKEYPYVKCIKDTWCSNKSNLNKVFKVQKDHIPGFCICSSISFKDNFISATKEEYDAQFIKKDYEILSILGNKDVLIKNTDFLAKDYWEYILNNKTSEIHSIKRLSDGEIFTIGDKIESVKDHSFSTKETILKFQIDKNNVNNLYIILDNKNKSVYSTKYSFNNFKKSKFKFVTEDGVQIFEGDTWFYILTDCLSNNTKPSKTKSIYQGINVKNFSTEQAAYDWIKMNIKQFSLEDIKNTYEKYAPLNSPLFNNLINELKTHF